MRLEPRTSYQAFLDEVEEQRKADEAAIARMLSESRTYQKVTKVFPDGSSRLKCGHLCEASERNPAELHQVRYCSKCTDEKFEAMGGNR